MFNFSFFKSKKEKEALDRLNKMASNLYRRRYSDVINRIDGDVATIIFIDWWNGGTIYEDGKRAKRYKYVGEKDWDEAHGWIMETISMGMG